MLKMQAASAVKFCPWPEKPGHFTRSQNAQAGPEPDSSICLRLRVPAADKCRADASEDQTVVIPSETAGISSEWGAISKYIYRHLPAPMFLRCLLVK